MAWGALACALPDVDVVASVQKPLGEFLWHRGPTHALWFAPLAGALLGAWLWRRRGREPGRLGAWTSLCVSAMLAHPLLDVCTSYGTQLLAPFSSRRFVLQAVAIVDPAYTLLLALALGVGFRRGFGSGAARATAAAALLLSSAYLALGLHLNGVVVARVRAQLEAEGLAGADVQAYPTLLQLPLQRVVARHGREVRVGQLNAWRDDLGRFESFEAESDPLIDAARSTPEGRVLEWFAAGQTVGRVLPGEGDAVVELDDLRYGLPGRPREGLWGLRFRFDAGGRPRGPVERFNRPLPPGVGWAALGLIREAYFN